MMSSTPSPQLLIVADDVNLREILQRVLVELGYAPTAAASLEEALGLVHQQPFDLIVTAPFSPTDEETLAALSPLRQLAHGIPIVVMASLLTTREVEQQGFTTRLCLPFGLDTLITAVAEGLNHPFRLDQSLQTEGVKRYILALMQGDVETVLALCTEDVRIYPWIVPAYPAAHPVTGRTAARAYLQEEQRYFGIYQAEMVRLYPCPHGVAVRLRLRWQNPAGAVQQQMVGRCLEVTADGQISQVGIPIQDERLRTWLGRLLTRHSPAI
jgi:CheY-like chemotaxis protein